MSNVSENDINLYKNIDTAYKINLKL